MTVRPARPTRAAAARPARPSLIALLSAIACGAPSPRAAAPPTAQVAPAPRDPIAAPVPLPEYIIAPSLISRLGLAPRSPGDDGGALVDGRRFTIATGFVDGSDPPARLDGGARVPARLGGGFLFWSGGEVLRSSSFAGALVGVTTLPFRPAKVSFGPKAVLFLSPSERALVDPATGRAAAVDPPGLADWATGDDATSAAVLHGGRVVVSRRGGPWTDLSAEVGEAPTQVRAHEGRVWLELPSGTAIRVDERSLERFASPPGPRPAPNPPGWTQPEPPIERAIRAGALVAPREAVVEASGAIARVDLGTGEIVALTERVVPARASCAAVRTPADVLFVCETDRATVVVAGGAGSSPRVEKSFPSRSHIAGSAGGALLRFGTCDGEPDAGRLCVRPADGGWRELDVSAALERTDAGASAPSVVRWIPADDGHAVAVIATPERALFDTRTGRRRAVPPDALGGAVDAAATRSATGGVLDRSWTARADGSLSGWSADRGVTITVDGRRVDSPFSWGFWVADGARAIAQDPEGHVWQSLDHGQSWREVLAPVDLGRASRGSATCSDAGCHLGRWLRPGWRQTAPAPARAERPPARATRVAPQPPLPVLACRELAPMTKRQAAAATEAEGVGFGATTVRLRTGEVAHARERGVWAVVHSVAGPTSIPGLRALRHGKHLELGDSDGALPPAAANATRTSVWIDAFAPEATPQSATVRFGELVAAAHASGQPLPPVAPDDQSELSVVPVLGVAPALSGGLLLEGSDPPTWLRSPRPAALPIATAGAADDRLTVSAVRLDDRRVALLRADSAGGAEVLVVDGGRSFRGLVIPAPPGSEAAATDALARAPGGELGVLRLPRALTPSTTDDPAILLQPDAAPVALAPWSTLTPGSDAACGSVAGSWRAIVQVPAAWVRVTGTFAPAERPPMSAVVRWSPERVCLEAIEVALDTVAVGDAAVQPWVVATFGATARAAVLGYELGVEVRQPVECALPGPARGPTP
ncbi:MAG: hypothetical protein IT376_13410 [Polyangiaceae bacterium]|nr:hypothetical protein [Polyangiaceae bacterium]